MCKQKTSATLHCNNCNNNMYNNTLHNTMCIMLLRLTAKTAIKVALARKRMHTQLQALKAFTHCTSARTTKTHSAKLLRAFIKLYFIAVRIAYVNNATTLLHKHYVLQEAFYNTCYKLYEYNLATHELAVIHENVENTCCYAHYINTLASFAIAAVHSA